ncbi:906_t:CDS:2 [Funneliformis geosporum]|uniref:906_t:CDS:1 n=1 Tax=Funneliformis geosporum TaxID=1117311 RepID=A0A9W4X2L0_9GLOM|nr:906_t:CDS:2 [Funneliformis geosporum]
MLNEDAKRRDQKQHKLKEIRLLILAELENQLGKKKKAHKEKLTFIPQDEVQEDEDDSNDLDKKVPWPFAEFSDEELTNILLSAKSEKEVTEKEYKAEDKGSLEWKAFIEFNFEKKEMYKAGITKERGKGILNAIDDNRFLIRVKFVRDNSSYSERHNYAFKIIDKYQPIQKSKRAGKKFVSEGPNIILIKKTKPGFWVGIDKKFLVRIIQGEKLSEYIELDAITVIYGLYWIWEPDTKRGYGLTSIRKQKISIWEKRMRQSGTRVEDVAELEKNT